jgi:hypothetical protein
MDEQSKAKLDAILATEPAALTDEDKAFLRARSSYLTINQREVYAEVLSAPEVTPEVDQATSEATSEVTEQESSADTTPKSKKASKKASVTE